MSLAHTSVCLGNAISREVWKPLRERDGTARILARTVCNPPDHAATNRDQDDSR